jgi:hypothetical protein
MDFFIKISMFWRVLKDPLIFKIRNKKKRGGAKYGTQVRPLHFQKQSRKGEEQK